MKMKNGLIAGILVTGAVINLSFTTMNNGNNRVSLSNIETLSSEETQGYCYGTGSVDCPKSATKVQGITYY